MSASTRHYNKKEYNITLVVPIQSGTYTYNGKDPIFSSLLYQHIQVKYLNIEGLQQLIASISL